MPYGLRHTFSAHEGQLREHHGDSHDTQERQEARSACLKDCTPHDGCTCHERRLHPSLPHGYDSQSGAPSFTAARDALAQDIRVPWVQLGLRSLERWSVPGFAALASRRSGETRAPLLPPRDAIRTGHEWGQIVAARLGRSALRLVGRLLPTPTPHMRKARTSCADSNGTCSTPLLCPSCRPC